MVKTQKTKDAGGYIDIMNDYKKTSYITHSIPYILEVKLMRIVQYVTPRGKKCS